MTEEKPDTYVVQQGDTLSKIALRFGVKSPDEGISSWDYLARINGIKDADIILPGQELIFSENPESDQTPEQAQEPVQPPEPEETAPGTEQEPEPKLETDPEAEQTSEQPQPEQEVPPATATRDYKERLTVARYTSIVENKLTQKEPLSREDIKTLQTALNELSHDAGTPDGIEGKNTCAGIISFLKNETDPSVIQNLNQQTLDILRKYNNDPEFTRSVIREATPPTHYMTLHNTVEDCLEKGAMPPAEDHELLTCLYNMGYIKDANTTNNEQIAQGITSFLKDNNSLEMMQKVSLEYYPYLVKYGQSRELNDLVEDSGLLLERRKEIIQEIDQASKDVGVPKELLRAIWSAESRCDAAIASTTLCEGSYHYSEDTWKEKIARYGEQIADLIEEDHPEVAADIRANIDNPEALAKYQYHTTVSTYVVSFHIQENAAALGLKNLNDETAWRSLYASHVFGVEGTKTLLENPDAPAYTLMSKTVVDSNQSYFINKDGTYATCQEVLDKAAKIFEQSRDNYKGYCQSAEFELAKRPPQEEPEEQTILAQQQTGTNSLSVFGSVSQSEPISAGNLSNAIAENSKDSITPVEQFTPVLTADATTSPDNTYSA